MCMIVPGTYHTTTNGTYYRAPSRRRFTHAITPSHVKHLAGKPRSLGYEIVAKPQVA